MVQLLGLLCGALIGLLQSSARREAEILVLRRAQTQVAKETGPQQRRSSVVRLAVSAGSDNAGGIGGGQPGNGDPLAPRGHRQLPSQGWGTFLRNHADGIASMDLFVVPTASFRLLYGLLILQHGRRQIMWREQPRAQRLNGSPAS
jgi:hypothetical protein